MNTQLPLSSKERGLLFKLTASMPREIETLLRGLSDQQLTRRPAQGFSLHEHVWHLADLESEGFSQRINAILSRDLPALSDFPGDRIAAERQYHRLPLQQGLRQFIDSRLNNLWILSGVDHKDWMRQATQEGVGKTCLVEIFRGMAEHDRAHLDEINVLVNPDYRYLSGKTAAA